MKTTPLYLRPNVQVEPLVDQWYAWAHLIPPATAARNLTNRHLKIMDSYISAPQIHANAVSNPKMAGGPFIDYGGKRVNEVRALRDTTRAQRGKLIELSNALEALDIILRNEAVGYSLEPLYQRVPETLRGYVELIYDGNNHPTFRLIEPLLYKSDSYLPAAQSIDLSLTTGDDRPFVLSTPRLPQRGHMQVQWPFADERIDWLFRLKREPKPWPVIREWFASDSGIVEEEFLRSLFTEEAPASYLPYSGNGVRWRYFGHACILIEWGGKSVLFDPVLSYTYESDISRYTYADLPDRIDFAVITHNHQDHVLIETLLQIKHKVGCLVVPRNWAGTIMDPSLKLTAQQIGIRSVVELGEMETLDLGENCTLTGLPFLGEHSDLAIGTKLAYMLKTGCHSLMFAADSCNIDPRLYQNIRRMMGPADVLFLGMECDGAPLTWLYGPLLFQRPERAMDESRRLAGCNYDQAIELVRCFEPKHVCVYAMGQEPWLNYVMSLKYTAESRPIVESNKLVDECRKNSICAERLFGEKEILLPEMTVANAIAS